MKILTAAQMALVDKLTSERFRIPSILLMENAGRSVVEETARAFPNLDSSRTVVLCGKGNNGGDGLVIARYLALRGGNPEILLFCDPQNLRDDALTNWKIAQAMGITTRILATPADAKKCLRTMDAPDVIFDALFGTGLSKPVGRDFKVALEWINRCSGRAFVVSVDIPSGLFADSAHVPGPAVRARLTVTFSALKTALVFSPAADHAGKVTVAAIGSPAALIDTPEHKTDLIDAALIGGAIPRRARASHKGTYGHVFVVAGSRGKSGAALMTGLSALRSGAGLVTLWLPKSLQRDVVGKVPELMTEFLPDTGSGGFAAQGADDVLQRISEADALVIGPGLGRERSTVRLIRELVARAPVPVVLDADGINAFASHPETLRNAQGQPVIITPHPGEMARLLGWTIPRVQKERVDTAVAFAREHRCFTILKGHQTVIADPAGRTLINSTGNPGMATGGTGDILAGMSGRFAASWRRINGGKDPESLPMYLAAAVYLHGLAGDLAAAETGEESLIATDLMAHIPAAFKQASRAL